MQIFYNADGKSILLKMVKGIQENKIYLGEVDGLIGDGDHGMNMNKGFSTFEARFGEEEFSFSEGLSKLSMILMNEIGGSMVLSTVRFLWPWLMILMIKMWKKSI